VVRSFGVRRITVGSNKPSASDIDWCPLCEPKATRRQDVKRCQPHNSATPQQVNNSLEIKPNGLDIQLPNLSWKVKRSAGRTVPQSEIKEK
jgi:hypothetical protein